MGFYMIETSVNDYNTKILVEATIQNFIQKFYSIQPETSKWSLKQPS